MQPGRRLVPGRFTQASSRVDLHTCNDLHKSNKPVLLYKFGLLNLEGFDFRLAAVKAETKALVGWSIMGWSACSEGGDP
jgi:hypothetical protein